MHPHEAVESLDAQVCDILRSFARYGVRGVFVRTNESNLRLIVAGEEHGFQADMLAEAAASLREENGTD